MIVGRTACLSVVAKKWRKNIKWSDFMKKSYTEVSFEIQVMQCLDVLTSSGEGDRTTEPNDDILFEDIFN